MFLEELLETTERNEVIYSQVKRTQPVLRPTSHHPVLKSPRLNTNPGVHSNSLCAQPTVGCLETWSLKTTSSELHLPFTARAHKMT